MTPLVRLVLVFHNHQPIGNFEGVFEAAFQDSYAPFLNVLQDYPDIPFSLHTSGSLLEWLVQAHPEYIDQVRMLAERGQIEIVGGPFYEPILACIPRADRVGQIQAYTHYLENLFGTKVKGMWVPERVWEQSFTGDITRAGIEYTVLDDYHFQSSGLREHELHGYYLTEDEGRIFKIFPGSERLRYTIPFRPPHETIDYLRHIGENHPNAIVTFGDDGEKFGTWPGTKDHVYRDNWLRNFLDTLRHNADWLKVCTMGEAVQSVPPLGKIYLSDCSYREMTEWALTTERQTEFHNLTHDEHLQHQPQWNALKTYLSGGFWRNFRVKYSESNEMYARMLELSEKLQRLSQSPEGQEHADLLTEARTALYRGQCNCPYWHGAFGGLYLPHLRNAIYQNLIQADNLLEKMKVHSRRWLEASAEDYNLDGRKELRVASDRLVAYLAPATGGHLYELDIRQTRHNLLATLNRRPEPYHQKIREHAAQMKAGHHHHQQGTVSIHDLVHFKQPDLDQKLIYDNWSRKSLVDHFLQPGLHPDAFKHGQGEIGDFVAGVYESIIRRSEDRVEVEMKRTGKMGPFDVTLTKTVAINLNRSSDLEIRYQLENLPREVPIHFGVEFQFAGMAAGASDRYYYDHNGERQGQLESQLRLEHCNRLGLIDEWLGVDASLELSEAGTIWTYPIETISQSEAGFEGVHQSCTVMPHWEFIAPHDGRWEVGMNMIINTSAAQARILREAAAESAQLAQVEAAE